MIIKVPSFYKEFKCIGSKCTDNCCIGWEIDIDENTMDFYKSVGGDFGKRLKNNIEESHFKLNESERCPFLNKNNLCDIIINLGEEHICEICTQHPRFHAWFGDYKESGLGLCCEEAVRIFLESPLEFETYETDEPTDEADFNRDLLKIGLNLRENLYEIFIRNNCDIFAKLNSALKFACEYENCDSEDFYREDIPYFLEIIFETAKRAEPIENAWSEKLEALIARKEFITSKFFDVTSQDNERYSKIAIYLIYRYFLKNFVFDSFTVQTVFTVCFFISLLRCLDTVFGNNEINNIKLLSKQIEYSEENLNMLYDIAEI